MCRSVRHGRFSGSPRSLVSWIFLWYFTKRKQIRGDGFGEKKCRATRREELDRILSKWCQRGAAQDRPRAFLPCSFTCIQLHFFYLTTYTISLLAKTQFFPVNVDHSSVLTKILTKISFCNALKWTERHVDQTFVRFVTRKIDRKEVLWSHPCACLHSLFTTIKLDQTRDNDRSFGTEHWSH